LPKLMKSLQVVNK